MDPVKLSRIAKNSYGMLSLVARYPNWKASFYLVDVKGTQLVKNYAFGGVVLSVLS